jgi:transmembrane sensor
MNDISNIEVDIVLLGKYLSGEATAVEAMAVDDWLTNPENKKQFNEVERLWNMLPASGIHRTPDLITAWEQLLQELPAKKRSPVFKLIINRYTVAASLLAVIITIVVILLVKQKQPGAQKQQFIVLQSGEKIKNDTLPDGSVIVINKNSTIQYAETFSKAERQLKLDGEAFFNVAHDKANPFIISVDDIKVEVVGTSFNITKTANPATIVVQVQSGIVKMYNAASQLMVHKGQTGVYNRKGATFSIKDTVDVNSIGYATGNFYFNDASMEEMIVYLEKTFGVVITADDNRLLQCRMSARFENKPLEYILDVMSATLNIKYTIKGNKVHISGDGCN